jgi:alkylhydroperoxidase/carboxymuconolactone decarboxylase family protein YurZ
MALPRNPPDPPKPFVAFSARYPALAKAWEQLHDAGEAGPLDAHTRRLIKLAVAIGALREGAVRASVRKGATVGVTDAEVDQVIALAAATLGMPATVAIFTWVEAARQPKRASHATRRPRTVRAPSRR